MNTCGVLLRLTNCARLVDLPHQLLCVDKYTACFLWTSAGFEFSRQCVLLKANGITSGSLAISHDTRGLVRDKYFRPKVYVFFHLAFYLLQISLQSLSTLKLDLCMAADNPPPAPKRSLRRSKTFGTVRKFLHLTKNKHKDCV